MAQLMPLPLTVSCFSKIQIGFTFLLPANLGNPGKRATKRVCACVHKNVLLKVTVALDAKQRYQNMTATLQTYNSAALLVRKV